MAPVASACCCCCSCIIIIIMYCCWGFDSICCVYCSLRLGAFLGCGVLKCRVGCEGEELRDDDEWRGGGGYRGICDILTIL